MKHLKMMLLTLCLWFGGMQFASAQADEIQQLILNVEKLAQFKSILSDMKTGYSILTNGYNTVRDISKGNFSLHETFLDGLMAVSPAVKNYRRVVDIISCQTRILSEYKSAYKSYQHSGNFNTGELDYISSVYSQLNKQCLQNLEDLLMVITSGELRMNDEERIRAIDRIYGDSEDKLVFLRQFNDRAALLSRQRLKEQNEAASMQQLYQLNP